MTDRPTVAPSIWPVILAGGTGTRLWPLSRGLFPKQFMALNSARTMLQDAADRLGGTMFHGLTVLCNDEHRFIAAEQMRGAASLAGPIVLEPVGRNTAPAAAVAALLIARRDPQAVILLAPADHVIADVGAFHDALRTGLGAARTGRLVTFGIRPEGPETGFGYIQRGAPIKGADGSFGIARFTEKPDAATARRYVADGGYFWNSGIFLAGAGALIDELARHAPDVLAAAKAALAGAVHDLDFLRLDRAGLERAPDISIDYAVMERTAQGAIVPVDMGWSDVGSFSALWAIAARDVDGNAIRGDVMTRDVSGSYLRSERGVLACVGLSDVVVVVTDDAVLVAARDAAQDVRDIVDRLKAENRPEPLTHTTVYRPWGSFQSVDAGELFQVKRITVKPGGRLSLQRHSRRAEHWVVVAGTATVTRGEVVTELNANESTFIPIGVAHRLENRADVPLHLIEVQSGAYLGEDDIERLDDIYGRK